MRFLLTHQSTHHISTQEGISLSALVSVIRGKILARFLHPYTSTQRIIAPISTLDLLTGRTHQIRLHCAHIGHPICGDLLYGASDCVADSYLNALKEHFHTVSLESTFSHNAAQAQKTQKLQEVDFGKKVDSRENVIFHKTAKPLESTCKNTQRAEILESTLHTSPRNTLLAQTLCLHAFSLHFCYDHTTYALSTHPPSWWLDSSEYPNGKT